MELHVQTQPIALEDTTLYPAVLFRTATEPVAELNDQAFIHTQVSKCLMPLHLSVEKHAALTRVISEAVAVDAKLKASVLMLRASHVQLS